MFSFVFAAFVIYTVKMAFSQRNSFFRDLAKSDIFKTPGFLEELGAEVPFQIVEV
jgi:hypothetical protein